MVDGPVIRAGGRSVAVFVVSHETRREVRAETLGHLATQGIQPHVQEQVEPPASWRVRRGVRNALAALQPWPDGGVLMLEDDIRLRTDWRPLLDLIVSSDFPTVCCTLELTTIPHPWAHMIRERHPKRAPPRVKPRVVPVVRSVTFYGTQCVYMPRWFLDVLWADNRLHAEKPEGMAFDSLLTAMQQDMPAPIGLNLCIPDLADHLSPPPVANRSKHVRKPFMFDWEAAWEDLTPTSTQET